MCLCVPNRETTKIAIEKLKLPYYLSCNAEDLKLQREDAIAMRRPQLQCEDIELLSAKAEGKGRCGKLRKYLY